VSSVPRLQVAPQAGSDPEATPIRKETTLEMVLAKLNEVGADAKQAAAEAREANAHALQAKAYAEATNNRTLEMHHALVPLERRVTALEGKRVWIPAALAVLALLVALVKGAP
jgi:hypothetical protein